MRIVRRFVFAVAFLVATVLLIRAAKQHGDFLFMFYPGILREVETFLSELTAKLDYVLWERLALICLIWAVITLLLDIILQENLLRWVSGVAAFLALLLCLFVGMSGLNRYAPSVAESMRLENRTDYSADELRKAAIYYRNGANEAAEKVGRGPDGQFRAADFETLGEELGSGMKNMIRTSYVFGGSTAAPKKLNHFKRYSGGPSVYCCLTGECCIDPAVEDSAMPFLIACACRPCRSWTPPRPTPWPKGRARPCARIWQAQSICPSTPFPGRGSTGWKSWTRRSATGRWPRCPTPPPCW